MSLYSIYLNSVVDIQYILYTYYYHIITCYYIISW
jgi:hypothetical protein